MILGWKQEINAFRTLKGEKSSVKYTIKAEIKGPDRPFMSNITPIMDNIAALEGQDMKNVAGKSSLESVALYIAEIIKADLDEKDSLNKLRIVEDGIISVEIQCP